MGFWFITAFPQHFDKLPWWFYRLHIYTLSVPYLYICPSAQHYDSNQGSNMENSHWSLNKRPSHGKLKLANSCWQTQVGVCERRKNSRKAGSICRQQFANLFVDSFCAVHTHQLEFAKTRLPTLVCRVKAAFLTHWTTGPPTTPPYPQQMPPLTHVCSQYECSLRKFES